MLITFPRRVRLSSHLGWSPTCAHHLGQSVYPLCLTFHRRASTGFLLFCLPFLSGGAHSLNPSSWAVGRGGGWGVGHAVESAWTQGRISVWYLPLLPKLGCHTGSLRKTSEDTWTIQWRLSVSSLPPFLRGYCPWFSGVFFIVPPILVSLFVGRVLKMLQQGYGTWWPCCCL